MWPCRLLRPHYRRVLPAKRATSRRDLAALIVIAALHATALAIMVATEGDLVSKTTFLLTWFLLNFFWLALLRRPASAALVSLAMVVTLILLSQFKYDKLMMTVNFVDVMILDTDTISFFLTIYPDLLRRVVLAALVAIPALGLLWWLDPYRVRLRVASAGGTLCFAGAVAAFRSPSRWSRTRLFPATATFRNSSTPASMQSWPT